MIKAIIFDMDGVIADTEPLHFLSVKKVVKELGYDLDEEFFFRFAGISEYDTWIRIIKEYDIKEKIEDLMKRRRKYLVDLISERLFPNPGLYELISDVKKNSLKIALVTSTNKENMQRILNKLNVDFDIKISGDDVKRLKPDPECYNKALNSLGLSADECIVIEDTPIGIKAAKDAKIKVIGITTTLPAEKLFEADKIINTLKELDYITLKNILGE